MSDAITVPFSHLVLKHSDIGLHRGRRWGLREVFGFHSLRDLPFLKLAQKIKRAYERSDVPAHEGWPAQRDAIKWLVDKGRDGIYAIDDRGIRLIRTHSQRYYIRDGNHRAIALYVLGEGSLRARIARDDAEWSISGARRTRS